MATQADNMIIRAQAIKTWDDKQQQGLEVYGRHNERFGGVTGENAIPRIQYYPITSHVPNGSQGLVLCLGGNPDVAVVVGMEPPDIRPTDLEEGEFKLYDKWDHYLHGKEDEWYVKVGPCEAWLKESGQIRFKCGSAVIEMSEGGVVHLNP